MACKQNEIEVRCLPAVGEVTITLPTTDDWPTEDNRRAEFVIEALDKPVRVIINPHQVVRLRT